MMKILFSISPGYIIFLITGSWISPSALGQSAPSLHVINTVQEYQARVKDDSLKQMVELKSTIPDIVYDLRYATPDNFTHQQLYDENDRTFLRLPAAMALKNIQKELSVKGLGLKIFDAYRPYSATVAMWNLVQDPRYVADPASGSGHNRGLAIDLTLIRLSDGSELNMGTGFDNFTSAAHRDYPNLPPEVLEHRHILRDTMEKYGFTALETEWWHFYWPNNRQYDVLNLTFDEF